MAQMTGLTNCSGFNWRANIMCAISDGKAFLSNGQDNGRKCQGSCSNCSSFLGVNIRQIGEKYLDGCCANSNLSV
jgi:hypothetical protein